MSNGFGAFFKKIFGRATASAASDGVTVRSDDAGSECRDKKVSEVWLYPDSEELHKQTLLKGRKIDQPVFQIGRRVSGAVHYPHDDPPDMLIVEKPPYTLSRLQCEIEVKGDKVVLRDLGSRFGTFFRGKRLGKASRKPSSVEVPKGSHSVVLGQPDGPHRFRLDVR